MTIEIESLKTRMNILDILIIELRKELKESNERIKALEKEAWLELIKDMVQIQTQGMINRVAELEQKLHTHCELGFARWASVQENRNWQMEENRKISRRVDDMEDNYHSMAEKLFTRVEILEEKLKVVHSEKKEGLSFMEAFEEMKKGNRVKRPSYQFASYINNGKFYCDHCGFRLDVEDIEATDWRVVE